MIKKLSAISLSIFVYLTIALPAHATAVRPCPQTDAFKSICEFDIYTIQTAVKSGVGILFIVAVVAALFFLIFGGIKWITSGGDKAKLETARNTIIASVIGLILVFSSYFILNVVLEFFGLQSVNKGPFDIPTL